MFGIGAFEFVFIIIVALIVLGPERLPELARQAGTMVRNFRQMYNNLRAEMGPEFDDFERGVRELRSLDPRQQVRNYSRTLIDNVSAEVPEVKQVATTPKVNLNQAARDLLKDDVLDKPLKDSTSQSASNGQTTPTTPNSTADDTTGHYE
jgi:sec-independent protein translocase protein TatB